MIMDNLLLILFVITYVTIAFISLMLISKINFKRPVRNKPFRDWTDDYCESDELALKRPLSYWAGNEEYACNGVEIHGNKSKIYG